MKKFNIIMTSLIIFFTLTTVISADMESESIVYANICYEIKQDSSSHVIARCSGGKYVEVYSQGRYWFVDAEKYINKENALKRACGCK